MKFYRVLLAALSLAAFSSAYAEFPETLTGPNVRILESSPSGIESFAVTADMKLFVSNEPEDVFGEGIYMESSKRFDWPQQFGCCNANAWGFIKVGEIWYGATWEFLRVGQIRKSAGAFVGPKHLRFPPLQNFRPRRGEIYGFMVSGIARNGAANVNIRERSNIQFWRWGIGPVSVDELFGPGAIDAPLPLAPIVALLDEENQAPEVDAGSDETITLSETINLDGTVTDDGLPNPPGAVTTTWSKFSGPGDVTFGDDSLVDTTAEFSQTGVYVLELEADDSKLNASSQVTITVDPDE